MSENFIAISQLNDFIFCPYSIYLHSVYTGVEEGLYHATPQINGKNSHFAITKRSYSSSQDYLLELDICSEDLKVYGKIDVYNKRTKTLTERKYKLVKIYKGQYFQLWSQFYCMKEMGYTIEHLLFYSYSDNKTIPVKLPTYTDYLDLKKCLSDFKRFEPEDFNPKSVEKCRHCIYCNLCDKVEVENVY